MEVTLKVTRRDPSTALGMTENSITLCLSDNWTIPFEHGQSESLAQTTRTRTDRNLSVSAGISETKGRRAGS